MLSFRNSKYVVHLFIEDYCLRMVETSNQDLAASKNIAEVILPVGLIENGRITDEIEFFQFIKELVSAYGLKNKSIRFNVPNSLVIMRQTDIPAKLTDKDAILEHLEMEIGKSIHLPFRDAIIDFPVAENRSDEGGSIAGTRPLTFFAAPRDEISKYTEIFVDASLKPISVDVGLLAIYRYFHQTNTLHHDHVYLIVEFNVNSIHLGIFDSHQLEFLRYQDLDLELHVSELDPETNERQWEYADSQEMVQGTMVDEVNELERIMNFYRFSLHKGDKQVTDLVVLGDYPLLDDIYENITRQYESITVTMLEGQMSRVTDGQIDRKYIPALGLTIRGGSPDVT